MSDDMKKLKKAFKEGIIVPGRNANGTLTLRGSHLPGFQPLGLEDFLISAFDEAKATIDPETLKLVTARRANTSIPVSDLITEARKKQYGTPKEKPPQVPIEEPTPPETPKEPTPEIIPEPIVEEPSPTEDTWTEDELNEIGWNDLRAMAKNYPECEGLTKKAEFVEALIGIKKL